MPDLINFVIDGAFSPVERDLLKNALENVRTSYSGTPTIYVLGVNPASLAFLKKLPRNAIVFAIRMTTGSNIDLDHLFCSDPRVKADFLVPACWERALTIVEEMLQKLWT